MSETPRTDLLQRLHDAGSMGLDLSPGDPLCMEAYGELVCTREALREALVLAEKWCKPAENAPYTDRKRIAQIAKENGIE